MINLLPITKTIILFSIISVTITSIISAIAKSLFLVELSSIRVLFLISTPLEITILFLLTIGWRTVWKVFPKLNEWIFPDLNGEWTAIINWTWNHNGDIKKGEKHGSVTIKQSILKFSIELKTDESESSTLVIKPFKDPESNRALVYYMYRSEQNRNSDADHTEHNGAAILKIPHGCFSIIEGNYFTDRNSFGRYTFKKRNN